MGGQLSNAPLWQSSTTSFSAAGLPGLAPASAGAAGEEGETRFTANMAASVDK